MARPTEFDREQALVAAMKLFWSQGYSAASLSQLLQAMDIGRSSFYAAFVDKRTLFVECLDLFFERTRDIMRDAWDKRQSPEAFVDFFERTLFQVSESRAGCGCLMVNTVLELADVDAELSQRAAGHLADIEVLFTDCFRTAQQSLDYPSTRSPEDLATCLMVVNQGLRVASRKGASRTELRRATYCSLATLGLGAS